MVRQLLTKKLPLWEAFLSIFLLLGFGAVAFGYINKATGVTLPTPDFVPDSELRYGEWPELSNSGFFSKVRTAFIDQKADFVEANLTEMKLRVYQGGVLTKEVPILTKGREGSWWETPAGLYKAESKRKDHFSSLAEVHLPWSIPFQGNFFIHGWPYYEDGTPVTSRYSGGCIRLSTEDAKSVYDMISVGMPILVFNEKFTKDNFAYEPRRPEISAEAYLAADLKNDYVFLSKNIDEVRPIASVTKLMTALVATDYINLDQVSTVSSDELVATSKSRLKAGDEVSAYDLLFPLLMESSNEAAKAYASILGPSRFANLMNEKAKALGMLDTHFAETSGADAQNTSTAEDLFALAKYLYNSRSFILSITAGKVRDSAYGAPAFTNLENFNLFEKDPEFIGGKIGLTKAAKETIVSVFETELNGEKRPIVFIALGSADVGKDVEAMRRYIRANY